MRASDKITPFQVHFLTKSAKERGLPKFATSGSVAFDLHADIDQPLHLKPGARTIIELGFKLWINPPGYGGFIFPRSGKATKSGLILANTVGVIDTDYQGQWMLSVMNAGQVDCLIEPGERIVQCVIMSALTGFNFVETEDFIDTTGRGEGGFGSTGAA